MAYFPLRSASSLSSPPPQLLLKIPLPRTPRKALCVSKTAFWSEPPVLFPVPGCRSSSFFFPIPFLSIFPGMGPVRVTLSSVPGFFPRSIPFLLLSRSRVLFLLLGSFSFLLFSFHREPIRLRTSLIVAFPFFHSFVFRNN